MRTVVLGPPPPELAALIARRRQLGLDKYDEVWDGEYHMAPMAHSSHGELQLAVAFLLQPLAEVAGLVAIGTFNLGQPDDFRVPDLGLHRSRPNAVWVPTAAVVVEIESPDDETWEKLPFYASRGVDEVLIVSAQRRSVTWLIMEGSEYVRSPASRLLGPKSASLESRIEWPQFTPVDEGN
jgi:hypothetical protein